MLKRIRDIHPLFYMPLAFLAFPILGVFFFGYPAWTLGLTFLFFLSYLFLTHFEENSLTNLCWLFMLLYVVYMTIYVDGGMVWFSFYFNGLLVFRFQDHYTSFRFLAYDLAMLLMVIAGISLADDLASQVMIVLAPAVNYVVLVYWMDNQKNERQHKAIMEKNRTINLLLAENERNRIGRDLHDTLGHVFAAMTLKTELALKQLEKEKYDLVKKELEELHQTSRSSMHDVRNIVNNLKFRTVSEEIEHLNEFFAMTAIDYQLQNDLDVAALSPLLQSSIGMILRELSNNVIKHSQAQTCRIHLFEKQEKIVMTITDDGVGFDDLTGNELKSIRDRLLLVKGDVAILSPAQPTMIQVSISSKSSGKKSKEI